MRDSTAIIHESAIIADDVTIGPWSYIGPNVEIGAGTTIGPHVVIKGPTKIGENNKIFQYASVGEDTQDKKYRGEETWLEIGDNNVIREFCTINRGAGHGGGITRIGNNNLFMAYVHVAHDCIVHNDCVFSNYAALAGHVVVEDFAIVSGFSGVHQYCHIGEYSFVGGMSAVTKDILPYVLVSGNPTASHGLNLVGLKRHDFSKESLQMLRQAYKIVFRSQLTTDKAITELEKMEHDSPEVAKLIAAMKRAERGFVR